MNERNTKTHLTVTNYNFYITLTARYTQITDSFVSTGIINCFIEIVVGYSKS